MLYENTEQSKTEIEEISEKKSVHTSLLVAVPESGLVLGSLHRSRPNIALSSVTFLSHSSSPDELSTDVQYATSESEMRWFNVPDFNMAHMLNAWEEEGGDVIVLIGPNVHPIELFMESWDLIHCSVEMLKINLRTNTITRTLLSSDNLDFGVINPNFIAKKNRFSYLGIGDPMPKICGVAKLNLDKVESGDCIVARRIFGEGCFGGEPFFVANDDVGCGDEDDGHLLSYVHDERKDESRFVVMDAKSPDLEVVAEILLPQRVPYGLHGLFVSRKQLQS